MNHIISLALILAALHIPAEAASLDRVKDGDTFVTSDGTTIRIVGIDAPENDEASTNQLKDLLSGRQFALIRDGDKIDKYGRTLARVLTLPDSMDVAAKMVEKGFAFTYLKYPCSQTEHYLDLEIAARRAGMGMWAGHFIVSGAPVQSPSTQVAPAASRQKQTEGITVYVTRTGTKYHRAGCRYLAKSCIPI